MPESPSWKWVLTAFAGIVVVVVIPAAVWAGSIKSDTASVAAALAEMQKTQGLFLDTISKHGERLAAIESADKARDVWQANVGKSLDRIEAKIDRR